MSCRKEVGLEPIIVLELDWWALGPIKVSRGAHDTYCREGVRVMMGFAARTAELYAKRVITCVAIS